MWRRAREPYVHLEDIRDDPSLASETLDHPDGWPQTPEVQAWLTRAVLFLAEHAPTGTFTLRAGWGDYSARGTTAVDVDTFLDLIATGGLKSDETYEVHVARERM